ncbi:MCM7 [Bugula neritina]|uniref:MCM7 n=1 Tax=Bugula neritina TaxID=10212 RepID=A0A7J7JXY1_BUGNE|nr:MCM7 [Bugula neritina]
MPDRVHDLRLAQHITYVHQHNNHPPKQFQPLDMKLMRRYIAACKTKQPLIPEELNEYISGAYVEMRKEARNNNEMLFTSPRTLLGIVRLATALARLRMADVVEKDDINEAMRLMEMSKDSLNAEERQKKPQSVTDQVYAVIRSLLPPGSHQTKVIKMADIEELAASKGLRPQQVHDCIDTYERLNVWQLDTAKTKLTFV